MFGVSPEFLPCHRALEEEVGEATDNVSELKRGWSQHGVKHVRQLYLTESHQGTEKGA